MAKAKKPPSSGKHRTAKAKRRPAAAAKAPKKSAAPARAKKPKSTAARLGRPKVAAEEPLYLLFHQDYQARQLFEFLRVQTVKELEQFSPQDIIRRLTQPVHDTVDRIRTALAAKNRCLAGDEEFAAARKAEE